MGIGTYQCFQLFLQHPRPRRHRQTLNVCVISWLCGELSLTYFCRASQWWWRHDFVRVRGVKKDLFNMSSRLITQSKWVCLISLLSFVVHLVVQGKTSLEKGRGAMIDYRCNMFGFRRASQVLVMVLIALTNIQCKIPFSLKYIQMILQIFTAISYSWRFSFAVETELWH